MNNLLEYHKNGKLNLRGSVRNALLQLQKEGAWHITTSDVTEKLRKAGAPRVGKYTYTKVGGSISSLAKSEPWLDKDPIPNSFVLRAKDEQYG